MIKTKIIDGYLASAYLGPGGGSQFEGYPLASAKLGNDDAMRPCAPAATKPKVYSEHYATRAASRH
jgi:hypothetical protein